MAACAGALALVTAAPLGKYAALWILGLLALAFWYSYRAKGTVLLGNCIVACCASSPILFGALIAGRPDALAWIAVGLSFTFMLAYETLKTIADRASDEVSRIRTFATWAGAHAAVLLFRGPIPLLILAASIAASRVRTQGRTCWPSRSPSSARHWPQWQRWAAPLARRPSVLASSS